MKYLFVIFLIYLSNFAFSQDSTRIKTYQSDKIQIESYIDKSQKDLQLIQNELSEIKGKISYNYELYLTDTTNNIYKKKGEEFYSKYQELLKKLEEAQLLNFKFIGYLEYNSILIQREEDYLKNKK